MGDEREGKKAGKKKKERKKKTLLTIAGTFQSLFDPDPFTLAELEHLLDVLHSS